MNKKAFTLIELLIVVVIIGTIYGLVISSMKKINNKEATLDFETLPVYLQSVQNLNKVSFICLDNCRSCALYEDDIFVKSIDSFMTKGLDLRFWHYDLNDGMREIVFTSLFDEDEREHDVCFRYEIFDDGSRSEMVIETKKYTYDYRGPLHSVDRYSSLQAVEESRQNEIQEVLK